MIEVYTDGSCWPNDGTGNGIFGFIVVKDNSKVIFKYVSGRIKTTNNRMELCGVISAIKFVLKNYNNQSVVIFCDSNYVVNGYNNWVFNWMINEKKGIKNWDIWTYLHKLRSENINLVWIKGHNGHKWNELIDQYCNEEFKSRYGVRAKY